jgi:hypothetical protein
MAGVTRAQDDVGVATRGRRVGSDAGAFDTGDAEEQWRAREQG